MPTKEELERDQVLAKASEDPQGGTSAPQQQDTAHPEPDKAVHFGNTMVFPEMLQQAQGGLKKTDQSANIAREDDRNTQRDAEYRASGGAGGTGGAFDRSLQGTDPETGDYTEQTKGTLKQLDAQKELVAQSNDVTKAMLAAFKADPKKAEADLQMTAKQVATAHARLQETDEIAAPGQADADEVLGQLFTPAEIKKHLGGFANGAHAFIDPDTSGKIEGKITDTRFKGWGRDANFVAPLDEANALNAKAQNEFGVVTLEDELAIPDRNWSRSDWNQNHELVRWVIPKPKTSVEDAKTGGILLTMATGKETGAYPDQWVAGGMTKGGAHEAKLDAIPREDLVTALSQGEIKQKIEKYDTTPDHKDPKFVAPKNPAI